jgi:hypothetical protein
MIYSARTSKHDVRLVIEVDVRVQHHKLCNQIFLGG